MAKLGEVCNKATSNIAQKDLDGQTGNYPIFGASGFIANVDFYQQEKPYIAVVKDGAGVGRIMKLPAKSSVIGTMQYIIPNENVDIGYLAYAMESMNLAKYYTGATIPHIYFKDYREEELPLPSLDEQRRIAAILDKVTDLINKRRAQLDKLDLLVKSRFVEMFGDPVLNPMNWPSVPLSDMADIVSGVTKGRKTKEHDLIEVPYMAVSNVKDGYIDWKTVKTIAATQSEIDQYRLLPDDVLMTEGGDPDKLGRGAIIKTPLENCIHQNHVFRVRLNETKILPVYFAEYLQHQKAKRYFLRCAKQTTGIASINMTQLKGLPTIVPSTELQISFNKEIEQVNNAKVATEQSLSRLEILKKTLMQQYFG